MSKLPKLFLELIAWTMRNAPLMSDCKHLLYVEHPKQSVPLYFGLLEMLKCIHNHNKFVKM